MLFFNSRANLSVRNSFLRFFICCSSYSAVNSICGKQTNFSSGSAVKETGVSWICCPKPFLGSVSLLLLLLLSLRLSKPVPLLSSYRLSLFSPVNDVTTENSQWNRSYISRRWLDGNPLYRFTTSWKNTPQPETHFYDEVQPFITNVETSQTSITNKGDSGKTLVQGKQSHLSWHLVPLSFSAIQQECAVWDFYRCQFIVSW